MNFEKEDKIGEVSSDAGIIVENAVDGLRPAGKITYDADGTRRIGGWVVDSEGFYSEPGEGQTKEELQNHIAAYKAMGRFGK